MTTKVAAIPNPSQKTGGIRAARIPETGGGIAARPAKAPPSTSHPPRTACRRPSTLSGDCRRGISETGGATAALEGWRQSTVDVDLRFEPDSDIALRGLAALKEELSVNVELASRR
jgi:hypothetical protein